MTMKSFKPYTPSRRFITVEDFSEITKMSPEKALTETLTKKGGRNNTGMIMVRFRGGGHKRQYRRIDFKREKFGVPAKVAAIEYDPNRSARLALLYYKDGDKRYIICPDGLKVGSDIMSGVNAEIKSGNALPLSITMRTGARPFATIISSYALRTPSANVSMSTWRSSGL